MPPLVSLLQAAIAASLADASAVRTAGHSSSAAASPYVAGLALGGASAGGAANGGGGGTVAGAVGLRNEAGEYNCFLNVIVQCLWQCTDFRSEVRHGGARRWVGWRPCTRSLCRQLTGACWGSSVPVLRRHAQGSWSAKASAAPRPTPSSKLLGRNRSRIAPTHDVTRLCMHINMHTQCHPHISHPPTHTPPQVSTWAPQLLAAEPAVSALHRLFQAFHKQREEDQRGALQAALSRGGNGSGGGAWGRGGGSAPPSPVQPPRAGSVPPSPVKGVGSGGDGDGTEVPERSSVDPTPLRKALAELSGQQFREGELLRDGGWGAGAGGHRMGSNAEGIAETASARTDATDVCGAAWAAAGLLPCLLFAAV